MFVAAVQKKREKLDTRAWIFFSSLSNACYAGYVYLVLIYFVYICFFFFRSFVTSLPNHSSFIIP